MIRTGARPWARVSELVAAAALFAFIVLPVARLAGAALGRDPLAFLDALRRPGVLGAIGNSVWTSTASAVLATALGTAAALATERTALPGRAWLRGAQLLQLVAPPFVMAIGWTRAYGPQGLSDQALGVALPGLYGPLGIVLLLTVAAEPLSWLLVAAALASRPETDLERAARVSGAGPWRAAADVSLPLLRPAILSSAVVTFVFGLNAFGVPAVLGTPAHVATITTRLYSDLAQSADPAMFTEAIVLALLLVLVAVLVVGPADAWLTGRPAVRSAHPGVDHPVWTPSRRQRSGAAGAMLVAGLLVTLIPLVAILLTALTRAVGLPPVPANWTLANFAQALDQRLLDALANSLLLGVLAASIVVPLGALLAVLGRRPRLRPLRSAATVGFALPGSALAVAVLIAYGDWLVDTLAIILVAYVAKFWALGQRQVAGALDRLPPDSLRAARASGAGPLDVLRSIAAPLLRPSLLAAWLVVFLFAVHELTMSSLLYGPTSQTLAVVVINASELGDPTVTSALAVLLLGLVAVIAAPVVVLGRRSR